MSSLLYALGRLCYRRARAVLALWFVVIAVLGAGAGLLGTGTKDVFKVPGEESFSALDRLSHVFPQISGAAGQVVVVAKNSDVTTPENRAQIRAVVRQLKHVDQVAMVIGPWNKLIDPSDTVSKDKHAALIQVQMDVTVDQILPKTQQQLEEVAARASDSTLTYHAGGGAYGSVPPEISTVEAIGLVVALVVLVLTFGSLVAAGLPLVTALMGISVSMAVIWAATRWLMIGSTTPFLALMIGLAVGIDYSLFILARHRDELAKGVDPEESTGRAVATAGSAVVFAGVTVIIALVGLAVTGLPFLAIMGVGAALSVLVAIAVCLTMTPAIFGILKLRLAPKPPKRPKKDKPARRTISERWLDLVVRFPKTFVVIVSGILIALAIPAMHMRLTLPDNGTAHEGLSQRTTYDLLHKRFGTGYNGQLVMTADIVQSTTPLKAIDEIKHRILQDPDVRSVPIATPNPPNADTMVIEIIPRTGPTDPRTEQLTNRLRATAPAIKERWGFDVQVTGMTAAASDLTIRLGKALLPFALLVLGLSLVLFTMVFRSIAVPIKATVNFVLSVGATFGAVVLVFQDGHFADQLNVVSVSPIVCFLPILLMSLLFGLSMDYEVFLVSRIREEYVHGMSAKDAIKSGFMSSSKVITAAAVIMIAVFAAFVPHGDVNTQPIAFALAVGVFIDAFMVRITLVPAVMALLGDKAWWMPAWLDKRLPAFDVEGEGVSHQLELADWPSADAHPGAHADRVVLEDREGGTVFGPVSFELAPGQVTVATGPSAAARTGLALSLTGRMRISGGKLKVAGFVVPEQMILMRPSVSLVRLSLESDPSAAVRRGLTHRTKVLVVDGIDAVRSREERDAVMAEVLDHAHTSGVAALVTASPETLESFGAIGPLVRVLDLQSSRVTSLAGAITEGALA